MKTYSSWTTRESGMINPGKGLPLFPSEQFWSLQVMYCDPADKREYRVLKIQQREKHKPPDGITWPTEAQLWRPIRVLTRRERESGGSCPSVLASAKWGSLPRDRAFTHRAPPPPLSLSVRRGREKSQVTARLFKKWISLIVWRVSTQPVQRRGGGFSRDDKRSRSLGAVF